MDRDDIVEIPAGHFGMGSDAFYAEEAPVREVEVGSFAIDRGPVTVEQFARLGLARTASGGRGPGGRHSGRWRQAAAAAAAVSKA